MSILKCCQYVSLWFKLNPWLDWYVWFLLPQNCAYQRYYVKLCWIQHFSLGSFSLQLQNGASASVLHLFTEVQKVDCSWSRSIDIGYRKNDVHLTTQRNVIPGNTNWVPGYVFLLWKLHFTQIEFLHGLLHRDGWKRPCKRRWVRRSFCISAGMVKYWAPQRIYACTKITKLDQILSIVTIMKIGIVDRCMTKPPTHIVMLYSHTANIAHKPRSNHFIIFNSYYITATDALPKTSPKTFHQIWMRSCLITKWFP